MKYIYWSLGIILAICLIVFFFVPAFAGRINVPNQISIGTYGIRIYGLIMAASILVGYLIARRYSWRFGISPSEIDDVAFWITITGILGARIYYVIFDWQFYRNDWTEVYKIWHGGLSIYGALIAGLIFVYFYTRKKAYSIYHLLDLLALSLPLSQALGRFGNFFNQEAFGTPTNLPWKMYITPLNRPIQYAQSQFFHPAFLYEAIWDVIVFVVIQKLFKHKIKPGVLTFAYLGLYSGGRFFIEGIRLDSSYIFGLKVDQITAVILVVLAGIMIAKKSRQTA